MTESTLYTVTWCLPAKLAFRHTGMFVSLRGWWLQRIHEGQANKVGLYAILF